MVAVLTPLQEVIEELSQDGNILRIKKLLVYACRRTWENDPERLNRFHLAELINDLLNIVPTLGQLRTYLSNIVKTLNKPDEYTLVANAIVNRLLRLYPEDASQTALKSRQQYLQVATELAQQTDALRIKKLLFCACRQTWENDPVILSQQSLPTLVQELHHLAPTAENLEASLFSIVRTLNRSTEYGVIAETVTAAFSPLYATESLTKDRAAAKSEKNDIGAATLSRTECMGETPASGDRLCAPRPGQEINSPISPDPKIPAADQSSVSKAVSEAEVLVRSLETAELFSLRLNLMKYTNPFQAKMLLYSVLHCPLPLAEMGVELKKYDLDELLRNLMRDYKVFVALQDKCLAIARALPDSQTALQTAQVILRLLKPFYSQTLPPFELSGRATGAEHATEMETGRIKSVESTHIHKDPPYAGQ